MNVIERIFFFIESQNIKKTTFEKKVGLPNGYISKIKGSPGAAKLEDILKAFPLLDRDWLLTGSGEMLKSDARLIKSDDIKVSALLKLADALSMHPIDFFSEKYCSVKFDNTFSAVSDSTVIKSQQRTIENLSETIKNLTSK